ncbi:MAG: hypothetical protein ACRDPC_18640 [Solirubrobacteraceae bacterium]
MEIDWSSAKVSEQRDGGFEGANRRAEPLRARYEAEDRQLRQDDEQHARQARDATQHFRSGG